MKTKIQILKESIFYIFVLGFLDGVLYSVLNSIIGDETGIVFALCALLAFTATCILMGYLFEKEKPLWLASLQYIGIGIFAALFTAVTTAIGIPFIADFLTTQTSDFWKNQSGGNGLSGLLLIIPIIILSIVFLSFGLIAYFFVAFFLGNLLFSFLLQWAFSKFNLKSTNTTSKKIDSL